MRYAIRAIIFAGLFALFLGAVESRSLWRVGCVGFILLVFTWFSLARLNRGIKNKRRGWRIVSAGRDALCYQELKNGEWQGIEIFAELLTGTPCRVIEFPSEAEWAKYPAWAQGRRDEIVARIKSEFQRPDYDYEGA